MTFAHDTAVTALTLYDEHAEIIGTDGHPLIGDNERAEWLIAQLRPYVEAPQVKPDDPLIIRAATMLYGLDTSTPPPARHLTETDLHSLRDLLAAAGVEALRQEPTLTSFHGAELIAICSHVDADPTLSVTLALFTQEEVDAEAETPTHFIEWSAVDALNIGSDLVRVANKLLAHAADEHKGN